MKNSENKVWEFTVEDMMTLSEGIAVLTVAMTEFQGNNNLPSETLDTINSVFLFQTELLSEIKKRIPIEIQIDN